MDVVREDEYHLLKVLATDNAEHFQNRALCFAFLCINFGTGNKCKLLPGFIRRYEKRIPNDLSMVGYYHFDVYRYKDAFNIISGFGDKVKKDDLMSVISTKGFKETICKRYSEKCGEDQLFTLLTAQQDLNIIDYRSSSRSAIQLSYQASALVEGNPFIIVVDLGDHYFLKVGVVETFRDENVPLSYQSNDIFGFLRYLGDPGLNLLSWLTGLKRMGNDKISGFKNTSVFFIEDLFTQLIPNSNQDVISSMHKRQKIAIETFNYIKSQRLSSLNVRFFSNAKIMPLSWIVAYTKDRGGYNMNPDEKVNKTLTKEEETLESKKMALTEQLKLMKMTSFFEYDLYMLSIVYKAKKNTNRYVSNIKRDLENAIKNNTLFVIKEEDLYHLDDETIQRYHEYLEIYMSNKLGEKAATAPLIKFENYNQLVLGTEKDADAVMNPIDPKTSLRIIDKKINTFRSSRSSRSSRSTRSLYSPLSSYRKSRSIRSKSDRKGGIGGIGGRRGRKNRY